MLNYLLITTKKKKKTKNKYLAAPHFPRHEHTEIEISKSLREVKQARFLLAMVGGCRYTIAHGLE